MNSFAVIVPSKTISNLIPCMESVWEREAKQIPVIVVDDGLSPNEIEIERLRRFDEENYPLWISGEKPFVFAKNVNKGIAKAGKLDVCILNDDALLQTHGGISALGLMADDHPEYGIIAPVTNVTGARAQMPQNVGLREVENIAFVCVYVPRRTIEKVGLLDERFVTYGWEDTDYCRRVKLAGLKIGVYDHCFVDHGSLTSTFRGNANNAGDIEPGRKIFEDKWGKVCA